jgi:hypothetical protein
VSATRLADLVALMVVLDMNPGGAVMDAVNEGTEACASARRLKWDADFKNGRLRLFLNVSKILQAVD